MTDKLYESGVRRKAARLGYRIEKSRQRMIHSNNLGLYMLITADQSIHRGFNNVELGASYDASLHEIEKFLAANEAEIRARRRC